MIAGNFQNTPAAKFWTSSHRKDVPTTGWYVGFDFGNSKQIDVGQPYKVRCVHGTPSCPVKRYEIRDADATVRDFATGLRWQRSYSQDQMAWSDAIAFCPNTFGGDWRLPSVTELLTIVDETREQPSIDPNVFPCVSTMMSLEWFWTSSLYAGDPTWAYYVTFIHGHEDIEPVTTHYYVRCVSWEGP